MKRNGFAISFAFPNTSQTEEEFKGGKQYDYRIDSAAYLTPGRSFNSSTAPYNHYFELRTRKGTFSLFDFTNVSIILNIVFLKFYCNARILQE
jgi:hypothetical protein